MTEKIGHPERERQKAEQDRQYRTGRIGLAEQEKHYLIGRTGQAG
jgi:hypothetical protein